MTGLKTPAVLSHAAAAALLLVFALLCSSAGARGQEYLHFR